MNVDILDINEGIVFIWSVGKDSTICVLCSLLFTEFVIEFLLFSTQCEVLLNCFEW